MLRQKILVTYYFVFPRWSNLSSRVCMPEPCGRFPNRLKHRVIKTVTDGTLFFRVVSALARLKPWFLSNLTFSFELGNGLQSQMQKLMALWGFSHYVFLCVQLRPKQNNITFWEEDTKEKAKTWGQNCKDLHSNCKFTRRADVGWNEGDPDGAEYQHTEGDQFSFIKVVGQFTS